MKTALRPLFYLEMVSLKNLGHRALIMALFFHVFMAVLTWSFPAPSPLYSMGGMALLLILMAFQGDAWLASVFRTQFFHHLCLQPSVLLWSLWTKIIVTTLGMLVLALLVWGPWIVANPSHQGGFWLFLCLMPYWVGIHLLVFALSHGHLQGTYVAPLLLIPLEIPLMMILSLNAPNLFSQALLFSLSSSFLMAGLMAKIIPLQLS